MKRVKPFWKVKVWETWKTEARIRLRNGLRYWAIALVSCLLLANATPVLAKLSPSSSLSSEVRSHLSNRPSENLSENSSQPRESFILGKQRYDAGRFTEAAQAWQRAAEQFAQQNQPAAQAQALRYLAIAQQDLGQLSQADATIAQALSLAQQLDQPFLQAQILNSQGSIQLGLGQDKLAYATYRQAEAGYQVLGDRPGILLAQLNQVQALQSLGFYRRAQAQLLQLQQALDRTTEPTSPKPTSPDPNPASAFPVQSDRGEQQLKAQTLRSLGQVLRSVGELSQAQAALSQSLDLFEQLDEQTELAPTLLLLGQLQQDQGDFPQAIALYQRSCDLAVHPFDQIAADLHRLRLLIQQPEIQQPDLAPARLLSQQLLTQLQPLPASRWGVHAQVNLAESLHLLDLNEPAIPLLDRALNQAQSLADHRAESYVLGEQGHLYESQARWPEALAATRQAKQRSAELQADEMTVQWLWQEGRILQGSGNSAAAIAPYSEAVALLKTLRQDLVAMNPEVQFSFRDQVEPVYRQLVSVLLEGVDRLPAQSKQDRLEQSRQTIEALQLAQVQNFLREACETYQAKPIEQIDSQAAVFYPIVLGDRLEVILSLPGQPLQHYGSALPEADQQRLFRELRQALNPAFPAASGLPAAQELYDRLIRPGEEALQQQPIQTLVFVLDDFLRSLPMAVLHDGDRYLIEKYSLALTPGLQLFDSTPLGDRELQLLAGGLTEARQGFSSLPGVAEELRSATQQPQTQAQAKMLLDRDFTASQLLRQVTDRSFNLLHLATHGQFSSNAKDTFLLTWDDRLGIKQLDPWLNPVADGRVKRPIEMLILSACQTAKGDRNATLGLAGLAVRSGARSTLATLWSVQDQSTADLIETFYGQLLQGKASRAESLRQAQLSLLRGSDAAADADDATANPAYAHPYYWAPFVLVGNWQ